MSGWEKVKSSKLRFGGSRSPLGRDEGPSSRTVRLGRAQPQAPTHRTIYCNDHEANLPVRFRVDQDGFFPADILFLACTNPDGVCYIETSNLDGETNLKIRKALERTWDYSAAEKAAEFKGEVQCEQPNNSLYTFTGNLIFQKQTLPLSPNQLLLRGCSLRNTEYIVGSVIFTGHETKVMMNAMNVPSKRSTLERKLDKLILTLLGTLFAMCFIGAIGSGVFIDRKYWYLGLSKGVEAQFDPNRRIVILYANYHKHSLSGVSCCP